MAAACHVLHPTQSIISCTDLSTNTHRHTDRQTHTHAQRERERERERRTHTHTHTHTNRRTDRHTHTHTDTHRHTHRQANKGKVRNVAACHKEIGAKGSRRFSQLHERIPIPLQDSKHVRHKPSTPRAKLKHSCHLYPKTNKQTKHQNEAAKTSCSFVQEKNAPKCPPNTPNPRFLQHARTKRQSEAAEAVKTLANFRVSARPLPTSPSTSWAMNRLVSCAHVLVTTIAFACIIWQM